ncbi:hypothetical protein M2277_000830 [Paenibacillus sp. LBL]|nr:hypothetical protein [Paenibacillus sp. LBL]
MRLFIKLKQKVALGNQLWYIYINSKGTTEANRPEKPDEEKENIYENI